MAESSSSSNGENSAFPARSLRKKISSMSAEEELTDFYKIQILLPVH